MEQAIKQRLQQLEEEKQAFIRLAQKELAVFDGRIEELKNLLAQPQEN